MVAQKKGRGAKTQVPKKAEETAQEAVVAESATEENNGEAEQTEQAAEEAGGETADGAEEHTEGEQSQENTEEAKAEEKKEEKVESGKVLVENLPSSYLFDYQDKLKELFSKHGEILSVK